MKCPKCGSKTYVIDNRPSDTYKHSLRRRRMCYKCKNRFSTYEVMSDELLELFGSGVKAKERLKQIKEIVEGEEDE